MPFAVERGLFCIGALAAVHKYGRFVMYGWADPSDLTTDFFSYLELLGAFSSLTLRPLGSGESVLDVSFLKVVGIIPGFPQHLHPRLLVQAQGLDVLPDPRVCDFIPLLRMCVQPGAKKTKGLLSIVTFFRDVFPCFSRESLISTDDPPVLTFLGGHPCICQSSNPLKYQWGGQGL